MTAKKSLGQHFLVDPNLQRKVAGALEAGPDDEVLEIGPGHGELTRHLAGEVGLLVGVELDRELAAELEERYRGRDDVRIVRGDILELDPAEVSRDPGRLLVIGNIPYSVTTPILFRLLERPRPRRIVVMVQREVADRIVAGPGGKEYGALTIGVRIVADVERITRVPRHVFRPPPRVDSTVLRIVPHRPPRLDAAGEAEVRTLVRAAFRWRRKQLQRILRDAPEYGLSTDGVAELEEATGFDLRARPETLSPDDFIRLAAALREPAG